MPRRILDFYETPPHYIAALLDEVDIRGAVYEPCVGEGAIAAALRLLPLVTRVYTNDIDHKRKADAHRDAKLAYAGAKGEFDWHVTNPPFSDELPILQNSLGQCANVAFLARLSFLEPTEDRAPFLEERPPTRIIVLPRYSFRPNDKGEKATDSVTCAWLVWSETTHGISVCGRTRSQIAAILRGLV